MERSLSQRDLYRHVAGSFAPSRRRHRHRRRELPGARERAGTRRASEKEMTPAASILEPNSHPALYVAAVLTLYVDLPDTPWRASVPDQRQARMWFDRGVPLEVVETALLLACLRRKARPSDVPPLPRIRSLAYFQPVIEELIEHPAPSGYLQYLRFKLRHRSDTSGPVKVQKSTFSN